jgi:hypothetical protein
MLSSSSHKKYLRKLSGGSRHLDAVGALYEPDDPFDADAIRLEFKGVASGNDYIRAFQLCAHLPTGVAETFAFPIANRFCTASPCGNSGAYGSTL